MRRRIILVGLLIMFFSQSGFAWVFDAYPDDDILIRGGYEFLAQPNHNARVFKSIHTLQLDIEKHWSFVRLFVHNIGYQFGNPVVQGLLNNGRFWDDLRFGAQLQFQEFAIVTGGIRFWTKLPNTENETGLGTDEMDFWIVLIQSFHFSDIIGLHLNFGFGIVGSPVAMQTQNDFWAGGIRLDFGFIPGFPIRLLVHGFTGFKTDDDKLALKLTVGHCILNWFKIFLDFEAPLTTNYIDYADPLDHTAWGGKIYAELRF